MLRNHRQRRKPELYLANALLASLREEGDLLRDPCHICTRFGLQAIKRVELKGLNDAEVVVSRKRRSWWGSRRRH